MFKKFLSFCLVIMMLTSLISTQAFAATTADSNIRIESTLSVEAPYAGVFAVTADQNITLENETGHYVELTAGKAGNIVLLKGANTLTANKTANLTFTALAGQGLDKFDTVAHRGFANILTTQTMHHYNAEIGPGATYTYNVNIPESGMYYINTQISDTASNADIVFEYETGLSTVTRNYQYGWCLNGDDGDMEYVYLRAGEQTVTATNTASHWIKLNDFRISDTASYSAGICFDVDRFIIDESAAEPTATPTPTATPAAMETVTYTAPYAGVFQVTSNKAVTLTNETGHYVTLAANTPGKLFLIQGVNTIATTDKSATLTFTELDDQGLEYLSSVAHNDYPYGHNEHTFVPTVNVAAGSTVTVTANVPKAGFYYLSLQRLSSPTNAVMTIETETGMYAAINETIWGWNHNGTDGNAEFVYLRAGQQTFTITNGSSAYLTFDNLRISETVNWHDNLSWDNVKITKYVPPVVYPDYVTTTSINFPGTASTLAGCLTGGTGSSASEDGSIWVSAGYSADFVVPCTDEGVYYVQVKSGSDTTVQVEANGTYYTDVTMSASVFSNKREDGSYALIYLNEGDNMVTLYNTGNTGFNLYNLEFKASSYLYDQDIPCDESLCLKLAGDEPRPTPSETAAPTATPLPTPTPTPTPDMTDAEQFTKYEAESVTFENVSTTTYNGKTAIVATNGYNLVYPITVANDTTFNLYVTGAAWKDVTLDIRIDGEFYKNYYQHFQLEGKNSSYEYQQDLVATFPLTKGSHTITIIPYADTYYFDSFVLEDHSSRSYKFIHGFEGVNTSAKAYDLLNATAQTADIDFAADTANLLCPEMNFWSMVGKDYGVKEDAVAAYNWTLENPVVTATNANGNKLNAGNSTVTIDCSSIPTNVTLYAGVYNSTGNKLLGNVNIVASNGKTVSFELTDVAANSTLKVFAIADADEITPHTSDGIYAHIYVATNGKGTNDGLSPETPLATIAQALTKVKTLNTNMTGDIIVHVAPGTYRSNLTINIDSTMSGKNGYKVIFKAEDPNNKPVISGGEDLTGKWKKVDGQNYWVATTTTRETRALYINGYQATLAKSEFHFDGWGYITPEDPINESHTADGINVNLRYETQFPMNLEGETGMMLVTNAAFANQRLPVDKVTYTTSDNMAHVYITRPRYHALLNNLVYSIAPSYGQNWYFENSMLFLDQPGEFFFDKSARKMYYYPYANEDMNTAETYCAVTDYLMNITGVSLDNPVENITFDGLAFKYGANDRVTAEGAAFTQTDEQWLGGETWYGQYLFPAQVTLEHASGIEILNCEFANLGSNALNIINGSNGIKVSGNYFHDISGTAVVIGHTMLQDGTVARDRVNTVEVDNNIIDRCAQEFVNTTGISLYYAGNVNIHHNDIKNLPYSGIVAGWGWGAANPVDVKNNTIAYNKITNVMQVLDDGAQIYTVGKMDNLHIHDNYLIDPGNQLHGGIYLDQCVNNTFITDNVITEATTSKDSWIFARRNVDLEDIYCGYNYTDGPTPNSYDFDGGAVTMDSNSVNVTEWNFIARKIMSCAGIEDTTRFDSIPEYPSWRTMRMLDNPITASN